MINYPRVLISESLEKIKKWWSQTNVQGNRCDELRRLKSGMSEKTLNEKLVDKKELYHIFTINLVMGPIIIIAIFTIVNTILGNLESTRDAILLLATIGFSYSLISVGWLGFNLTGIFPEASASRRKYITIGILAVFPQLAVLYWIILWNFNLVFIIVVILCELFFYIIFTILGTLPGNRISFWLSIFCILGLSGFLIALSPYTSGLGGVTVEIIGAFIGVFAAISLGEVLKETENLREGRKLRVLILEELRDIEQQLIDGVTNQVPIPVWSSALADGSFLKLPSDFQKRATQAHEYIHYFNLAPLGLAFKERALKSIRQVID